MKMSSFQFFFQAGRVGGGRITSHDCLTVSNRESTFFSWISPMNCLESPLCHKARGVEKKLPAGCHLVAGLGPSLLGPKQSPDKTNTFGCWVLDGSSDGSDPAAAVDVGLLVSAKMLNLEAWEDFLVLLISSRIQILRYRRGTSDGGGGVHSIGVGDIRLDVEDGRVVQEVDPCTDSEDGIQ